MKSNLKPDLVDRLTFSNQWYKLGDGIPSESFIVTKNIDGSTASVYGDDTWNINAYGFNNRNTCFTFLFWKDGNSTLARLNLIGEIKWVTFCILFLSKNLSPSIGTIINKIDILRKLARIADSHSATLKDILQSSIHLKKFIESSQTQYAGSLSGILHSLYDVGHEFIGFLVPYLELRSYLSLHIRTNKENKKQTATIPTRIYSILLTNVSKEADYLEGIVDRMIPLLERFIWEKHQSLLIDSDLYLESILSKNISSELIQYELTEHFFNRNLESNINGLSRGLLEILVTIQTQIQAYTGMRISEVLSLPFDCLEESVVDGMNHYLIAGVTTKLNFGKVKRVRWVTNSEGKRAVLLAQKIASVIYTSHGALDNLASSKKSCLLFTSFGLTSTSKFNPLKSVKPSDTVRIGILSRFLTKITNEDLLELENIDMLRDWRSDPKFEIGNVWPFQTHQLRRSLALYSQRSGIVSLPSLKRQLQHITLEMALYYSRGSSFAKNLLLENKGHFGREWQDTQAESQYLAYASHVLFNDKPLGGGHGNWVNAQRNKESNLVWMDREQTLKRFKKGELAFKETLLGGCVNTGACNSSALDLLNIECLEFGCKHQTVELPKLKRAISIQSKTVAAYMALDSNSVEYRTELKMLKVLEAAMAGFENLNGSRVR